MITYALSHVTDDQGINSAMALCGEGATAAFRLSKYTVKHVYKKHHEKRNPMQEDPLISDACSAYRGGYVSTNDPEVQTLLRDFVGPNGMPDLPPDKPFYWMGDNSDLSWFWKKTPRDTPVMLHRSVIDEIPDEALRQRVVSAMTKARLEGTVTLNGDAYFLTDAGKEKILSPDFIQKRLRKECSYLNTAYENLDEMRKTVEKNRIEAKLEELGRLDEFKNCDWITINKETLLVDDTAEDVTRFYVPGTRRTQTVDIPKADLIELDGETLAGFLRKDQEYLVNGEPMKEPTLFAKFDNKNKKEAERIKTAADRAETLDAEPEKVPQSELKAGQEVYVLRPGDNELEIQTYTVARINESPDGNHLYRLHPEDPSQADRLIREELHGTMFYDTMADAQAAADAIEKNSYEQFKAEAKWLADLYAPESQLHVPAKYVEQGDGEILLHPKDAPHESIVLDSADVQIQEDGSAIVHMNPNTSYTVKTGDITYTVSQQGAEHLLEGVARPVEQESISAAAKTIAETTTETVAKKATEETAKATAKTTAKVTTEVVAKAIPAVDPVTTSSKLIAEVVSKSVDVASAGSQVNSLAQKL